MVATVASDEPQIAPKKALAPTVVIASPPLRCPMNELITSKSDRESPACEAKTPIITNSGMTERV